MTFIDLNRYTQNQDRARLDDHFLYTHMAEDLTDRLQDIKKTFKSVLNISPAPLPSLSSPALECPYPQPLPNHTFDLILSCHTLGFIEDIDGWMHTIYSHLNPGGLFMCNFLGGETLKEFREAFWNLELKHYGGVSNRFLPMVRFEDTPKLFRSAPWSLPVSDQDIFNIEYQSLSGLLHDIRSMGSSGCHCTQNTPKLDRAFYTSLKNRSNITAHVITLTSWKE